MSEIIRALQDILREDVMKVATKRCDQFKREARELLNAEMRSTVLKFANDFKKALNQCISAPKENQSTSSVGEKALGMFMAVRMNALPAIWKALYFEVGIPHDDPLLSQCVNTDRRVFKAYSWKV